MASKSTLPPLAKIHLILWRFRFVFLALTVAISVYSVVDALRPAGLGAKTVVVTSRDIYPGEVLDADSLTTAPISRSVLPAQVITKISGASGKTSNVFIPSGAPIWSGLFVSANLVDKAPPGFLVVTLDLDNQHEETLLAPGRKASVWVRKNQTDVDSEPVLVTKEAVILAVHKNGGKERIFATKDTSYKVILAVPEKLAPQIISGQNQGKIHLTAEALQGKKMSN